MEANKRHKRSASTGAANAPHSGGAQRSMRRYTGGRSYGKFQGTKPKAEKKNLDTDIVAAGLSTIPSLATATVYCLNLFNTGSTALTVTGRHCVMKSLLLRMSIRPSITINGPSGVAPTTVRVLVVYDRQPSGALASVASILGATTYGTASPLSLANSDRFSVLLDEKIPIGGCAVATAATNATVNIDAPYFVDRYVKVGLPCEANGASFAGSIAGIATGAILLLAWSDIAAASNPPTVDCSMSRVRFTDA